MTSPAPSALRGTRERDDGILDALGTPIVHPSIGQRLFLNRVGARAYATMRDGRLARLLNLRSFAEETTWIVGALELRGDEIVVDLPCGQGNFTEAVARAVPRGKVIGIDLSDAMLALARKRLRACGLLSRTFLVRASAQELPLADASVDAVSACGGLHLFPEPDQAIAEMRRVMRPGGRVAGLTFLAHADVPRKLVERAMRRFGGVTAFDFDELGRRFESRGFTGWRWERGGLVGYFAASVPR